MSATSSTGHAVIVGTGVGGLAAAVALHQRGWKVTVLEQAPRLAAVGSGIALFPNALRTSDVPGVRAAAEAGGRTGLGMGLRRPSGRWLSRPENAAVGRRYGRPCCCTAPT